MLFRSRAGAGGVGPISQAQIDSDRVKKSLGAVDQVKLDADLNQFLLAGIQAVPVDAQGNRAITSKYRDQLAKAAADHAVAQIAGFKTFPKQARDAIYNGFFHGAQEAITQAAGNVSTENEAQQIRKIGRAHV